MEPRGKAVPRGTATSPESAMASELFDQFVSAATFKSVLHANRQLCELLRLKPTSVTNFYPRLKAKLHSWRAASLWTKLDKRASHKCYNRGKACPNTRVLIIGAGPCGLRAAIEAQLLGAKVVVLEKRDRFSRNNVLHLWPFVIHDLRNLGAKKFFGKFCAGSIDHISIRQLQIILLKVALLLGVEVHENVGFESLIEPPEDQHERRKQAKELREHCPLLVGTLWKTNKNKNNKIQKRRTLEERRQMSMSRKSKLSSEELEERKKKRKLYMKNYRAKQSKQDRAYRLQQMRQHASEIRATETKQAREARLQQVSQHAAEIRDTESEQDRAYRLQLMRQHAVEIRAKESEPDREARLQQVSQHAAEIRDTESEQDRAYRLQLMRQHAVEIRAKESEPDREARLQQVSQHAAEIRDTEAEQDRAYRLQQMRQHAVEIRAKESEQDREAYRFAASESACS
ncbi:[F-actin]-monooxygenase MICAL3 [Caerostris darwini]|uniref:[F-actin]-monooxygenase MICAL3 n=1 Tax=Caerostris darwini TaxID=1538125 RepID=A0AAV4R9J1_9ARAC|nr:[F-actin]-monooxygenase MICAL3 [Caerostris darwini]